ncbi:unnamed protein product [Cylindrotheca closterium]|uniref:Uncharacterized protein n=1 Tax=Cylindrotheca closterium TaxID=2856 RepID=A0AAD2G7C4_9STRA|nr:unnamed protein product [Cylindrotheca closterium]
MKGTFQSAIGLSVFSLASAFTTSSVSSDSGSTACVQQKLNLLELGSAVVYTCGDNQNRGAGIGATRVVNFDEYSPNGDEIVLSAGPVIGYIAHADHVKCALGSTVTVLQVRNDNGEWTDSGEVIPPVISFDEQCPDTTELAGRWIEANSAYTDCAMEDFQCNWVIVPDEFYGSAGPYYTERDGGVSCMVPETYVPVCQTSNLERFNDFVRVRGDGLSMGIEGAFPSLYWYNNIATAQENRWVCKIPQGAVVEISQGTPLSASSTIRQAPRSEAATLYACEGAVDECTLEFAAPPVSNDTTVDPLETKPVIGSTQFDGVESTNIGDANSICQQMEVLSMEDGNTDPDDSFVILQGLVGKAAHAFCSNGTDVALPEMPGNPEWLPAALTESEEWVPMSGSRECEVPYLELPPNFHPALTCAEGFNLVASIASGFNPSVYHSSGPLYMYGDNATDLSDTFNSLDSLSNANCRQRRFPSGATGIGSWAQLKLIATAGVLLMTLLAW